MLCLLCFHRFLSIAVGFFHGLILEEYLKFSKNNRFYGMEFKIFPIVSAKFPEEKIHFRLLFEFLETWEFNV